MHRGWDSYRYAPKSVAAGAAAETSLERAMRLRREFLDALKECGATAAQEVSLLEGGDTSQRKKAHPAAAPTEQSPQQTKLSKAPAAARSSLPEDTTTIKHSGGAVSLDADAVGEEAVGQAEGDSTAHARPCSETEASGGGRKPSIPVVGVLPGDRVVSLAGQAVEGSGTNAEEREGGGEEQDKEEINGRRLAEKDGKSRHAEEGEPRTMDQADRQPQEAGSEHQQRETKGRPTEGETETRISDTSNPVVETAGRRVGGVVAIAGEERSISTLGGRFVGDEATAVRPTGPADARAGQRDAEVVDPDPHRAKDGDGREVRPTGRQWGRDSCVVPTQKRAADSADTLSDGAELEFGNSGVWEHMEGEGVEGEGRVDGGEASPEEQDLYLLMACSARLRCVLLQSVIPNTSGAHGTLLNRVCISCGNIRVFGVLSLSVVARNQSTGVCRSPPLLFSRRF